MKVYVSLYTIRTLNVVNFLLYIDNVSKKYLIFYLYLVYNHDLTLCSLNSSIFAVLFPNFM